MSEPLWGRMPDGTPRPNPYDRPPVDWNGPPPPGHNPYAAPLWTGPPPIVLQRWQPTPEGRSAVLLSAVLSLFLGVLPAAILAGNHRGNELTRQNLCAVLNLQLTYLVFVAAGIPLGIVFFPVFFAMPVIGVLFLVAEILTAVNITHAYDNGRVYSPFMALKFL